MITTGNWSILGIAFMPAGTVAVAAAATNNNIFGANTLRLFALPANSKVLFLFSGTRSNAAAGGSGGYRFFIDGVAMAPTQTVNGTQRTSLSLIGRSLLGPGDHTVDLTCTAAVDIESIHDSGTLIALGSIGT